MKQEWENVESKETEKVGRKYLNTQLHAGKKIRGE